ncbi:hypothetical protein JXA84_01075 [candidate division WOR-3 bacterium]|nr:hypothetical protein [candidate division WOR-3 bacterium]
MSMIHDMMTKMSKEERSGILTIITDKGDNIYLGLSSGKIKAAIWQTKEGKAVPLWFYLQTNSELINDEEFDGLDKLSQEKGLSPGELLSGSYNLSPDRRIKFIKGKIREIAFNVFSLKDEEVTGTTFAENELLYPRSDLEFEEDLDSLWNDYLKYVENMELIVESIGDEETLISVNSISPDKLTREERFIYNFVGNKKYLDEILRLPIPSRVKIYKTIASLNQKKAISILKKKSDEILPEKKIDFNFLSFLFFAMLVFIIGSSLTLTAVFLSKEGFGAKSNVSGSMTENRLLEKNMIGSVVSNGVYPYTDSLQTSDFTIKFRRVGGKVVYEASSR